MMPIQQLSQVLHTALGLVLLWFLIFRCWREYRITKLREQLFAVRQELFDYAADANLPFDHPAYAQLRMLMNSMIRFAHTFTALRFFMWAGVCWVLGAPAPTFLEEWLASLKSLSKESQDKLCRLHSRCLVLVVQHLATSSPLLMVLLLVFAVWALLNGAAQKIVEAFTYRLPGVEVLETQLIRQDMAERKLFKHPEEVAC